MSFRPLHNQVVVRTIPQDQQVGSIVIPENVLDNKRPESRYLARGVVVSCGEGYKYGYRFRSKQRPMDAAPDVEWFPRKGGILELEVKPGDVIIYSRMAGEEHVVDGEKVRLLPEDHVLAVIEA